MREARALAWAAPAALPLAWWIGAGRLAIGRRTPDLVSHVWAVWNGTRGDPTRSALAGWPDGVDLLPIFGGWAHTFLGVGLARGLGLDHVAAYSGALALVLLLTGIGGVALARATGAGPFAAAVGGILLQLDGFVLSNAVDGRPEHAGLGVTALALAAATASWRRAGWSVATGLCGAAVFVVSWEHALWLFAAMPVLALALGPSVPGSWRRWGIAALVAALAVLPWVASFLPRALAVRALDEGRHTLPWSADQALALLDLFGGHPGAPPAAPLGAMLLLPWTARREDRRAWAVVGLGLGASLLLALGPTPGLRRPGDLGLPGPYLLVQSLPLVGWFHSPARLAMGWSLAAAAAGALLVEATLRRRAWAGLALAALLLGSAAGQALRGGTWPRGGFSLPPFDQVRRLAALPGEGAVLDLPPARQGVQAEQHQLLQLLHGRPVVGSGFMAHLARDPTAALVEAVPLFAWVAGAPGLDAPPPFREADGQALGARGVRFVALHPRLVDPRRRAEVVAGLEAALGPPDLRQGGNPPVWECWDLRP